MAPLRLVSPEESSPDAGASDASLPEKSPASSGRRRGRWGHPRREWAEQQRYKELNRLVFRVLQLDDILHRRCTFNPEKAADIKQKIEAAQEQLAALYAQMDLPVRPRLRRVRSGSGPDRHERGAR